MIDIFSFLFGAVSTIVCAIYLFIRFLDTIDNKFEKEFLETLAINAKERSEMRVDTSRFSSERKGKFYIKIPDHSALSTPEKHYGFLMNNMLFLFTNSTDKSAKNIICFDECSVSVVRNKTGSSKFHRKNAVSITGPRELYQHSKVLHFYFDFGKDLETWYWQFKEAASITANKTVAEEKAAKQTQKFYEELPNRLHVPNDQLTKPIYSVNNNTGNPDIVNSNIGVNSSTPSSSHKTGSGSSPKFFDELPSLRERIKSVTGSSISSSSSSSNGSTSLSPSNSFNNSSGSIDNVLIDKQINTIITDMDNEKSGFKTVKHPNGTSQTSAAGSHSPTTLPPTLIDTRYDWLNVFLARVFYNLYDSESLLEFAANKITKKINKLKKPSILKSITLQNLDFGPNLPIINDAKLVYLTPQGEFSADATITYHGGFTLTIKIEIMISFRNHSVTIPFVISVLVKSLTGKINIQCLPPPTKRLWIGFYEEPDCDLSIDTSIGQSKAGSFTNIPKLAKIIVTKLKAEVFEMLLLPNMEDIPLPHPSSKKKVEVNINIENTTVNGGNSNIITNASPNTLVK